MATLVEIANSGASIEVVVELIAKQVEKRLKALESQRGAEYESNVERLMADVISKMSNMKPQITVSAAKQEAPIIHVAAPAVTVMEKEGNKSMKISFERNLAGSIESATIIKE